MHASGAQTQVHASMLASTHKQHSLMPLHKDTSMLQDFSFTRNSSDRAEMRKLWRFITLADALVLTALREVREGLTEAAPRLSHLTWSRSCCLHAKPVTTCMTHHLQSGACA